VTVAPALAQDAGPLLDAAVVREFGPTLVIAPHPDDESLGCGGTLALLAQASLPAWVLTVTDGAASHPSSRRYPPAALRQLREGEARAAIAQLGLPPDAIGFLQLPDTATPRAGEPGFAPAVERIAGHMAALEPQPATLLIPWRREPHCDHRAAWELTQAAVKQLRHAPRLLEYPIWLWDLGAPDDFPQPGEILPWRLDMRAALPRKRAAIAAHRSQTTALIDDAPDGFRLSDTMLERAARPWEVYFEAGATSPQGAAHVRIPTTRLLRARLPRGRRSVAFREQPV
jgi:LmbE family N-acetylglucosaminyl deacetylase